MRISKVLHIFLAVIVCSATIFPARLHQFHTTLTRIDYNAGNKLFEISIQIFTHDLFAPLERKSGRKVDLEKNGEVDKLIQNYLYENFALTDQKGVAKTLKWVGKEIEADTIRVYLEIESDVSPKGYKLKNTLFFESYNEQANIVVCRYNDKKADLLFKAGDNVKEITENK